VQGFSGELLPIGELRISAHAVYMENDLDKDFQTIVEEDGIRLQCKLCREIVGVFSIEDAADSEKLSQTLRQVAEIHRSVCAKKT